MSIQYGGDKITFADGSTVAGGWSGFKNRIINGDMRIDQRNAGASVSVATTYPYTLDRWQATNTQNSKFSVQRNAGSVTPPVGFANYLGITSSSAYSVLSTDNFGVQQPIEGLNTADLAWGTASASSVTLGFWVRSSLTGTFGGNLSNSAGNRCYVFSYTISSANTWEYKTITVPGDTTGTWLTTNGVGIYVIFNIGAGSSKLTTAGSWGGTYYESVTGQTSVVGTNGATFYITGVQLEKGSMATSFDYRPYGTELQLCQRYFEINYYLADGYVLNTEYFTSTQPFAVVKRALPSVTFSNTSYVNLSSILAVINSSGSVSIRTTGTASSRCSVISNWAASAEL